MAQWIRYLINYESAFGFLVHCLWHNECRMDICLCCYVEWQSTVFLARTHIGVCGVQCFFLTDLTGRCAGSVCVCVCAVKVGRPFLKHFYRLPPWTFIFEMLACLPNQIVRWNYINPSLDLWYNNYLYLILLRMPTNKTSNVFKCWPPSKNNTKSFAKLFEIFTVFYYWKQLCGFLKDKKTLKSDQIDQFKHFNHCKQFSLLIN